MKTHELNRLDRQLEHFLDELLSGMGRPERVRSMGLYARGLLLDGERKSMQPMASRLAENADEEEGLRQSLQQCVAHANWDERELFGRLACKVDDELPGTSALVLDDTGFPKKGVHSVGVARQYSGTLGRTDNCQVATSLHLASEKRSAMIGMRLYLPEVWTEDRKRCRKVGVPDDVKFKTKWELALDLLDGSHEAGVRRYPVIADAGYGEVNAFRSELERRGYEYLVGISSTPVVWPPGKGPLPPKARKPGQTGRPRTRHLAGATSPVSVKELAVSQGRKACCRVTWRQGSKGRETSWFGAVRVRVAHKHALGRPPEDPIWLIYQWRPGDEKPTKFWFSNLPARTTLKKLVYLAMLRWRVERDYQELKGEIGLDHFEGRTWRGFHHHAALCAMAHAFLALQPASFFPSGYQPDLADGPKEDSVRTDSPDRQLPSLQKTRRHRTAPGRTIENVIR